MGPRNGGKVVAVRGGVLACSLIWAAVPANAQSGSEPVAGDRPDADAIVARALDVASRQRTAALDSPFEYVTAGTVETLDAQGNVARTETDRRRHYLLAGHFYAELIARDGRALDPDDARDERERRAEFIREARRHAARGERYDPDEMHVDFDSELMARYETTLVGSEIVRGEACWVIRFAPRPGRLPDHRRIDKALNRSIGRLWITQHDYRVVRVTFETYRSFRWLWGIAGTLRHATGRFDLQWIGPSLWGLASSQVEIDLSVLFGMKSIRRRIRSEWIEQPPSHNAAP